MSRRSIRQPCGTITPNFTAMLPSSCVLRIAYCVNFPANCQLPTHSLLATHYSPLQCDRLAKVLGVAGGEGFMRIIMRLGAVDFDGVDGGQGGDAPRAGQVEAALQAMHKARAIGVARAG